MTDFDNSGATSSVWSLEESEVPFEEALEASKERFRQKQQEKAGIVVPASDGWQSVVYGNGVRTDEEGE